MSALVGAGYRPGPSVSDTLCPRGRRAAVTNALSAPVVQVTTLAWSVVRLFVKTVLFD